MSPKASLNKLLNDKVHGSSELLNIFLKYLKNNSDDLSHLREAIKAAKKKLGHFPAIQKIIKSLETPLQKEDKSEVKGLIKQHLENESCVYKKIYDNAKKHINKCGLLLTISHSKTLIEIFRLRNKIKPGIKVFVCESRPLNEGNLLAKELKRYKIKNQIITEASAGKIIKQVDAVVIGADQILKDGSIVNKTGSRILSALAKYEKLPVYVLASRNKKILKNTSKKLPEDFEIVESNLITNIFTD
jgi:translation initiation factor eIF-2B subunit delta